MPHIRHPHLENAFHNLQHAAVRDLAWCCFSAPVMNELPGIEVVMFPLDEANTWQWLHNLDQHPQRLVDHLQTLKSSRLGIYYEALWHFYFSDHPQWELLEHNLQIDRNGITLGAFDFLCRRGDQFWHIETAVKFYLCNAARPTDMHQWQYWVGPAGEDRLDLKLNHLRNHQLPLHQTPEGRAALLALYPQVSHWNTGLCLQGYLFSPEDSTPLQNAAHENVNQQDAGQDDKEIAPECSHPHHGRGHWLFADDMLARLEKPSSNRWVVLERAQWLAPVQRKCAQDLLTDGQLAEKICTEVIETGRPFLIALMAKTASPPEHEMYWLEQARLFIVPNGWPYQSARPGTASPSRNT